MEPKAEQQGVGVHVTGLRLNNGREESIVVNQVKNGWIVIHGKPDWSSDTYVTETKQGVISIIEDFFDKLT